MKNNLSSVQALRGIGALLVVMFHAVVTERDYHWRRGDLEHIGPYGQVGADIFFVILGFVIVLITFNKPHDARTSRNFMIARVLRIVPLYWVLTTAMATVLAVAPHAFNTQHLTLARAVTSFLSIPYRAPGELHSYPLVYVGWTLSYEFLFYAVFAGALLLNRRLLLPSIIGFFGLLTGTALLHRPTTFLGGFATDPIMLEFVFGCIIGWAFVTKAPKDHRIHLCLLVGSLASLAWSLSNGLLLSERVLWWGLSSAFLIAGIVFLESSGVHIKTFGLATIGDASYSIYLVQAFTLPVLARVLSHFDGSRVWPAPLITMGLIVGSAIGGYIGHVCLERPLTRAMIARTKRRDAGQSGPTPVAIG